MVATVNFLILQNVPSATTKRVPSAQPAFVPCVRVRPIRKDELNALVVRACFIGRAPRAGNQFRSLTNGELRSPNSNFRAFGRFCV